ncbi:MAG: hypothetical protein Q8R02_08510 [Hyphomonadaceae bacterium]|nr:hypothetical protein [Hyphomonadaceae bacterium]
MNVVGELLFPGLALFSASLVLTAFSIWIAGRMTPWFLNEAGDPPSVRSYFLDPWADTEQSKQRIVTSAIAVAVLLASLLAVAVTARIMGISPATF